MDDIPIAEPPPGVTANFENPESLASSIYITVGICIPLILVFTSLRFYTKIWVTQRRTWDDVAFTLGTTASLTYFCLIVVMAADGTFGVHQYDILLSQYTKKQILLDLVVEALYGPAVWLVKLSLFILSLEVFGTLKWLRWCAIGGAVVTGLFYFSILIALTVLCAPTTGTSQLDYLIAELSPGCVFTRTLNIVQGAVNIGSDLYLIFLPLPAIWSLHLTLRKKLAVSAIFATGLIACISSMLGLKYRIDMYASEDETWTAVPVVITSIVEITAGITVSCMPTTAAVFRRYGKPFLERVTPSLPRTSNSRKSEPSWTFPNPNSQRTTWLKGYSQTTDSISYGKDEKSYADVINYSRLGRPSLSKAQISDPPQLRLGLDHEQSPFEHICICETAETRGASTESTGWFT